MVEGKIVSDKSDAAQFWNQDIKFVYEAIKFEFDILSISLFSKNKGFVK